MDGRKGFRIAFVRRVVREKGLAPFIELAASIDFVRIERIGVFGDGADREAIKQRSHH